MQQGVLVQDPGSADRRATDRLFHRDLPGGGYVAIEITSSPTSERHVRVVVERRSDRDRRTGHKAPIIHDEAWAQERGIGDLYRLACDNVAIARGLLKLTRAD